MDYGGKHPFEQRSRQMQDITTESVDHSGVVDTLRMHFITEPLESLAGQSDANDIAIDAILNQVLPAVQELWTSHLSVFQVRGSVPIESNVCFGVYDDQIPSSILANGVDNADLVMIVSGFNEVNLNGELLTLCKPGVLAGATSCVLDQFDRPLVGFINFCLDNVGLARRLEEDFASTRFLPKVHTSNMSVATIFKEAQSSLTDEAIVDTVLIAAHEVGHVLGMDSKLFIFFYDSTTGTPRTPRPLQIQQVTCVDGSSRSLYFPAENTIKSEITHSGLLSYVLVTPRVATVTRNQFDCQSLNGARLENRPGEGCTGSHFDERLFFTELMGPVFSGTSDVLSPLTLALLEDSGWYRINYEGSQVSPFGFGAGCGFVNDACIIDDKVPAYAVGTFCTDVTNTENGAVAIDTSNLLCDPSQRSIAFCDLFNTEFVSAVNGKEFDENAISYFTDTSLKSVSSFADYCPVPSIPTGIDCTDETGTQLAKSYSGETYGLNSRCINFEIDPSSQRKAPGCFDVQCDTTNRKVIVNGNTCEYDSQLIPVTTLAGSTVNMICPNLKVVCPELFCQSGCSGRGTCNFSTGQCECFDAANTSPICMTESDDFVTPGTSGSFDSFMGCKLIIGFVALILSCW